MLLMGIYMFGGEGVTTRLGDLASCFESKNKKWKGEFCYSRPPFL